MPRQYYLDRIAAGAMTDDDLAQAIMAFDATRWPPGISAFKAAAQTPVPMAKSLPTVLDLAAGISGIDWPGVFVERFGAWAGDYFDEGQALWSAPRAKGAYRAWRAVATHDLTPEIVGLRGFAAFVAEAPETATEALASAALRLAISPAPRIYLNATRAVV